LGVNPTLNVINYRCIEINVCSCVWLTLSDGELGEILDTY